MTFTARGRFGLYKKVSLQSVSFAEKDKIDLDLKLPRALHLPIDTTTSNVETAIVAIHPRESRAQFRALE